MDALKKASQDPKNQINSPADFTVKGKVIELATSRSAVDILEARKPKMPQKPRWELGYQGLMPRATSEANFQEAVSG